jgi:putative transcriptional regulator
MIKIRIKEMAKARGIKNAHRLQLAADLSPATASRFWKTEIEKISMETLDRLCRALDCQPGDLFVYAADKKDAATGHSAEKAKPTENEKSEKPKSSE